jgi:hypothetical protein
MRAGELVHECIVAMRFSRTGRNGAFSVNIRPPRRASRGGSETRSSPPLRCGDELSLLSPRLWNAVLQPLKGDGRGQRTSEDGDL